MQGRFRFVDWFGIPRGLEDTDNLQEAIKTADDFQCEVIDTENGNQPVYNCWSDWQEEWRNRNGIQSII